MLFLCEEHNGNIRKSNAITLPFDYSLCDLLQFLLPYMLHTCYLQKFVVCVPVKSDDSEECSLVQLKKYSYTRLIFLNLY
jgi:hypothetical protein